MTLKQDVARTVTKRPGAPAVVKGNEQTMQLISVNIGKERAIRTGKVSRKTGIYKEPVVRPVRVTSLGLTDDVVYDTRHHGGVDQAVYLYGMPDYEWWSEELGRDLYPGTFGENLTITGLESARYNVGDLFYAGSVILQVTAPRIPCATLAARMEDPTFVKRFRSAERPGIYCRVLQEGFVREGEVVRHEPYQGETLSVIEMFRSFYEPHLDEASLRRHLVAPIAVRDRLHREEQLRELLAEHGAH